MATTGTAAPSGIARLTHDPRLERWAPLLRFPLLFWIWGWAAYDYKLLMDISVRGLIVTSLFFLLNITFLIGYRTRTSALLLAATMIFHGFVFHHRTSMIGATLLAGSALLPIGAYLSADRYLAARGDLKWYDPKLSLEERPTPRLLAVVVAALALFLVGAPFYKQVLNRDSRWIRAWVMFNDIGHGLVLVDFSTIGPDGHRQHVDYLDKLGYTKRPFEVRRSRGTPALADIEIIGTAQLDSVIRRMCRAVPDPDSLRLSAKISAVKRGWKVLYTGTEAICLVGPTPDIESPRSDEEGE